jgi:hypothetical protein
MKQQWWLLFLGVAIAVILSSWNWYQGQLPRLKAADHSGLTTQQLASTVSDAPTVEAERLWADVVALSFPRYTEADRRRARDYIVDALATAGWTPELQPLEDGANRGVNIVATRSGKDPNASTVLLAAHYDTVEQSPGADDNATSIATVLEAARLLGPDATTHTLQLALFDLEEIGLVGSTAFAQQLTGREALNAIVLDMVGYACYTEGCQSFPPLPITPPTDRGDFLAAIGDRDHPQLLDSFTQANQPNLPPVFTLAIPTMGRLTPDFMRSDHVPFWRKGLGAVLITDTANFRNPHYHQASDTADTLDRDFLVGAAQRVVNATRSLLISAY